MNSISRNLKNIRKERNLTQGQMAALLGVTQRTVSNWENGKSMPPPDALQNVADRLDTDINHILYGKPQAKEKGYLKLFVIFAAGFILAEFIQSLRPAPGMLGADNPQAVRLYNMTGFPLMMFCVPMVYTPPAIAFAKWFRTEFIVRETVFSKYTKLIHKILAGFYIYYILHFSFNFTMMYILPDRISVPEFIHPLWQIITIAFYSSEIIFVFIGLLWGLRGKVAKTINTTTNDTHRKNTIAVNLKNIRVKNNMTQEQMAQKLFVTQQTVSSWEKGRSMPDLAQLMDIAEKLDIEIYALLYSTPTASKIQKTFLHSKIAAVVVLCILWLICDGTIFHNLPGMQAPVTSKPAILYFATIPLRDMLEKAVIKPLLFFMLPQIIVDYFVINKAVKVKPFKYANIVKVAVVLFVLFFITGLIPVFMTELKEAVRFAPNIWFKIPVVNLPYIWRRFANFVAVNIAHNHPWAFSALGFVYSYFQKPQTQPYNN